MNTGSGRQDSPVQSAGTDNPDINAYSVECAFVELLGTESRRHKSTLHRVVADNNEPDARIQFATEHAPLSQGLRLVLCPGSRWCKTGEGKANSAP